MKEKILEKAVDLFLSFGFKSVTMDDIANELAMSKKTIYSHFSTKLKLVKAATFYVFDQIDKGICSICSSNQNPIEELYSIKSLIMEQLKGEKTSPQYQLEKYYPKIFKKLKHKQFESIQTCVSTNLQRGIELGYYRGDLNIDFITRLYFNGLMGIQNVELFPVEKYHLSHLKDSYLEYHIRAITTDKGLKTLQNILKK